MVELSCVIITKNEEAFLPKLLKSLKNQTFKNFEIIVSDYNSKDKTREIARKYGCKITDGGLYATGRNRGAKLSSSDYLLFLDADCILPRDFLEINFNRFKNSHKGVGTVEIKPLSKRIIDKFLFKLYHFWVLVTYKISPHCSGASLFIKKEVFNKVGGFDEKIVFAEDHALAKKSKNYGFIILPREIYTSVRRLDKEGRFKFVCKYIYAGLYRLFYREIEEGLFKYG